MNLLYVIFTHNRPKILQGCLQTLFEKTEVKPDRVLILDDFSENDVKIGLFKFALENKNNLPIDFVSFNKNIGYGTNFEVGLSLTKIFNPKYVFFVESDYIFRKKWAEDVLGLFDTDVGQKCAGISGYDNPDFYDKSKYDDMFRKIIADDFGEDNVNRTNMFKKMPITLKDNTAIEYNGVSNSCGTMYLDWQFCMMLMSRYPEMQAKWWDRMCNKQEGGNRRYLADGILSHGLSYYWSKWAKEEGIDTEKYFPLLNICPSVSNHLNALGINGNLPGIQEGQTFVGSPTFKD